MRFLIDAQLPPSLQEFLRQRGHEGTPLRDLKLLEAEDEDVWHMANEQNMVIITKDEDFARRIRLGEPEPAILWLRLGNATNRILTQWLAGAWPDAINALQSGEKLVEVV